MAKGLKINPYITIWKETHRPKREIKFESYKPESIWGIIGFKDAFKLDEKAWESVMFRPRKK